jgi:hypothetical protein
MTIQEDAVAMLTAMGFEASQATEALTVCGGNIEQAANYLLTGGVVSQGNNNNNNNARGAESSDHSSSQTQSRMVHSSMSQYTVNQGKSACTCMSLVAAEKFLQNSKTADPVQAVSSELLQDIVTSGVAAYQRLQSSSAESSVEHLSAEEVLAAGAFPALSLQGGIRQGILSHDDANNPQGLLQQLTDCRSATGWTCVLITKTPETVLVCLPPSSTNAAGSTSSAEHFLLLDSHPRPQQFGAEGSYARIHDSMPGLVQSLSTIFPITDLGPDIPEMMAIMYNSFDLYPLHLQ